MAVCLALVSGILDRPLADDFICFGEIGLSGECRSVSVAEQRINEAARLGFNKIAVPKRSAITKDGVEVHGVKSLIEAIRIKGIFAKKEDKQ
jgi:DNA repair protein RadA/Sms